MPEYNKLVRDRIPEIIEANGEICEIRQLLPEEYREQLQRKLREEFEEYDAAGDIEELVDLVEVVLALAALSNVDEKDFEQLLKRKRQERGGFTARIFLLRADG